MEAQRLTAYVTCVAFNAVVSRNLGLLHADHADRNGLACVGASCTEPMRNALERRCLISDCKKRLLAKQSDANASRFGPEGAQRRALLATASASA